MLGLDEGCTETRKQMLETRKQMLRAWRKLAKARHFEKPHDGSDEKMPKDAKDKRLLAVLKREHTATEQG
jgi:hypothetical protein